MIDVLFYTQKLQAYMYNFLLVVVEIFLPHNKHFISQSFELRFTVGILFPFQSGFIIFNI